MFNYFKIIKYQLYLLQLENYEPGRYFRLLWQKGLRPQGEQRKQLVWTGKAKALLALGGILCLLALYACWRFMLGPEAIKIIFVLVAAYLLPWLSFCFYALALVLLWLPDTLLKALIVARARSRINSWPDTKIIGIAGSYGKTTMKAVLQAVLGAKQAVLSAPESVNTPVGIARWILQQTAAPAVLILEMGEHYPGDVAKICRLARPDIAIITGINEAHLERMKSLERTAAAIFELAAGAKPGALVLLNGDDQLVMAHYKEYVWPDHQVKKFQISNFKSAVFDQANLAWQAKDAELGELTISLLGEYALGDAAAAIEAGRELGLDSRDIAAGISQIRPVAHRLQPIKSASGILVIDDAYNGNSAGASAAINALARFGGRRKLYITPGLVETGKAAAEVHQSIGRQLAQAANVVILIKNSVTPFIAEGIAEAKTATKIIWFDSAAEAHQNLKSILQPGDVIVFQNDWGDQYV